MKTESVLYIQLKINKNYRTYEIYILKKYVQPKTKEYVYPVATQPTNCGCTPIVSIGQYIFWLDGC